MSSRHSFVEGALILTAAGLSVRFMGAGLRVFLAAIMGDEGIGLYQMAYPVYTALLAISTAGIPIAVSKLVAEYIACRDYRGAYRVFQTALLVLIILGAFFSLLLYYGAGYFVQGILKDQRAYYPLVSISPAIFLVTVMSAFRGFFQGQQEMKPTALSQVIEQVGRVVLAITLVYLLIPKGVEFAAAGATFGAVSGAFFSLLLLLYIFFRSRKSFLEKMRNQAMTYNFSWLEVLHRIVVFSIPITLGSLVIPLINLVDLSVVPYRLHVAGFATEQATALYGQLTGMANSLIQFPIILTISLAMSLVPAISEAQALNSPSLIRKRTGLAFRITLFFSIPAAFGLFVLAEPTTAVLFDNVQAAYPLSILAFGIIFLSLYTATSGILQGLGRTLEPVKNMLVGASVKFILSWFLTAVPELNIGGAALSTVIGFSLASLLNIRKVSGLTGWNFVYKDLLLKPLVAALIMSLGSRFCFKFVLGLFLPAMQPRLAQGVSLLAAILAGMFIYALILFLAGGIRREELDSIGRLGQPLKRFAKSLNLLKE